MLPMNTLAMIAHDIEQNQHEHDDAQHGRPAVKVPTSRDGFFIDKGHIPSYPSDDGCKKSPNKRIVFAEYLSRELNYGK